MLASCMHMAVSAAPALYCCYVWACAEHCTAAPMPNLMPPLLYCPELLAG